MIFDNNKIYASGHTNGIGSQFVLYCIDSLGNVLWNKEYGNPLAEDEFPRLTLWDNKLVLCGTQDRNINNRPAPIMNFVITDLEGNLLNTFNYGEENESTLAVKIITDKSNNCLASFVYCPDTCFLDLKAGVVSFDTAGSINWELDLPYSYNPYECVLAQIDSNNLCVKWFVDNTTIPNHDLTPPAIFFSDMSGNMLDTVVFQNQTLKEIRNIEPMWERGLVGCGHEYPDYLYQSIPKLFGWLFRMDENREVLWERSYIDSSYQGETFGLRHVISTSDGGCIATGTITNYMTGVWESHNWILKLDSMGCLQPSCGNLNYVTGTEEAIFLKGKDIKIFPNPASDYINVEFPLNFALKNIVLNLVSNEGRTIQQTSIDTNFKSISLSNIASGTYYAIISRSNEIIASKRIIIHH